ncbi:membrane-bound ATP synthase, F0 sector, subunit b [Marinobacter santoriniensis NKSG1]|uniref:ATP synthase subunit b n=1 Tax=Marinobacter santoriniensis NKSG1 TaxID=1288826 RepID=M7CLM1_9GAMM|nr:F0F1 ATP synthase subunit B [Marinobacter santoriniensis]EMP54531.1 membrane-bound ATP synthase, F0 sector, subunit b [Marinobacter santoriniensis NKSG1]
MSFNLTFIGQMIAFAVFVWLTMRYVWTPITKAMEDRQKKIADGLSAADRANRDLELAQEKASQELHEAKQKAAEIIEQANKRSARLIDEAKENAREEGERILVQARGEIEREQNRAKEALRAELASLVVIGAEKILETSVDAKAHSEMLDKLSAQL